MTNMRYVSMGEKDWDIPLLQRNIGHRYVLDIILWLSISTLQRTLYGGKGADRCFPLMSPPVKRCHCPGPPVAYIHTYRQLAWRQTKKTWGLKHNIKNCVFAAEKIVKTSSWMFSFEQFAKCLLSKEGEALRKWDMTSLSWSKNFSLSLLIFLASW